MNKFDKKQLQYKSLSDHGFYSPLTMNYQLI